jgi:carboxypeptidase D
MIVTFFSNFPRVEYPVGTGFSIGKITANSQEDIAKDFIGFFRNFQETFGISNYKIYVTGSVDHQVQPNAYCC